ncbi:MAG: DEAD/DEAH box helicase [Betaproteobacteria bacterium]|nr:DEAD/DEAH box helicase [Betaproteobacteria bacterium]
MKNTTRSARKKAAKPEPRLSRLYPPTDMAPEAWQTALRRQYGREQDFALENIGTEPVFSEFRVTNATSRGHYRVAIRGTGARDNYCSCPDYATNELGTCKHIEFTLARLEKKRGARTALKQGYQPPFSEIYLRYGSRRSLHFRAGGNCPAPLHAAATRLFDEHAGWTLAPEHFSRLDRFLAEHAGKHEIRVYDDALDFIAQIRDGELRSLVIDQAFPGGAQSPALNRMLKARLHPYQAEGALFAARAGRCLIGDDMGLGKTIQAIAAAEILSRHLGAERVLVVCPASLKHQWELELARFAGHKGLVISGGQPKRRQQYAEGSTWKIAAYDTLARDLDLIAGWSPDVVIVDEAQRIKNWNTIAARALKRIASPYAFVLTGTPLENRLEELISIVQFVDQHRLGPTWRLLHEHQVRDDHGRVVGYRKLDAIGRTLAPVMIRRRRSEVLSQLPKRTDKNVFVVMTEQQMILHEENREIVARIVHKWRKYRFLSDADQRRLTCALQNMRMSCNSTFLLDHETDHGVKADELTALLEDIFEDPDAKVVVFSQWLGTHELIARRIIPRGWGHVLFYGGVPSEKRGDLIERFRHDPQCRVFLSTDAGGVGLNLQHAATVVNMDQPWNPAVLEQRIARVHRMGQQRSVQVVNFIAQGTIEEGMLSLLGFKKSLFAGVLDGGSSEISMNGTRLARFIEGVEKATGAMGSAEIQEPSSQSPTESTLADAPSQVDAAANAAAQSAVRDRPQESAGPEHDALRGLIDTGIKFLTQLAAATQQSGTDQAPTHQNPFLETDAKSGRSYLRLPLPEPQTLATIAQLLTAFLPPSKGK